MQTSEAGDYARATAPLYDVNDSAKPYSAYPDI